MSGDYCPLVTKDHGLEVEVGSCEWSLSPFGPFGPLNKVVSRE